jgi:hypothetical protein
MLCAALPLGMQRACRQRNPQMLSCKGKALEFLSQKHICKQIFLCELEFDVKFFDHGSLLFCRQLNEKDKELEQLHKKLESECDDYTQQIEDIKTDLVHVQQELLALCTECEHKDKQVSVLCNTMHTFLQKKDYGF